MVTREDVRETLLGIAAAIACASIAVLLGAILAKSGVQW